jgi:two-component system sensor histidine kinase HydH
VENIIANALGQDASNLAAAEKRDLLARLLGRLAHEVRNPLSSLDIHVQLLEEDLATLVPGSRAQLSPRLEIIRGELHRLESIVSQFLRLAGPSALDLEQVEIGALVLHVCDLLRPEAAVREIEIQTGIADALPPLKADPVRLTQALLNLVINAIQAVGRKGTVRVNTQMQGPLLAVAISDTGPGIPPERLPALFDPYYTTKVDGHGLGLWIAQQIITAHGGSISARNEAGGGAVFTVLLPLQPGSPSSGITSG